MESLDSRLKRIEQRLSSIEKFIAENIGISKTKDVSIRLGRMSEPVHVSSDYKYDSLDEFDSSKLVKSQLHQVDNNVFNRKTMSGVPEDTLVTAVSGLVLILALFFGARFLIDSSLLTPVSLLAIGAVVGLSLTMAGPALIDTTLVGVQYLPAVGLTLVYTCILGATNFYSIIPKNIGLGLILCVSWLSLYTSRQLSIDVYQIISVVGAYVLPLYISFEAENVYTNLYYLIASVSFVVLSQVYQTKLTLLIGAYLSLLVCGLTDYFDDDIMNRILFTFGHFVIFTSGYFLSVIKSAEEPKPIENYIFLPSLLLFYALEFYYLGHLSAQTQLIFSGSFGLLLLAIFQLVKMQAAKVNFQRTTNLIFVLAVATLSHLIFYNLISEAVRPALLILASFAFIKLGFSYMKENNNLYLTLTYLLIFIMATTGIEVIISQINSHLLFNYVNTIVFTIILLYAAYFEEKIANFVIKPQLLTICAHFFILAGIYSLIWQKSLIMLLTVFGGYFVMAIILFLVQSKKIISHQP